MKQKFLGFIIWIVYKILSFTWRVRVIEPSFLKECLNNQTPVIFAHWHGDEIPLLSLVRKYRIATITSTSKDGQMIDTFIRLSGGSTSRGSSTRGAVNALKGIVRLAKLGHNTSFAVDGPKGPIYQIKPGVFELSRLINSKGGYIFCAGLACDKKWVFHKSWNKAFLPKPFSKLIIYWSDPLPSVQKDQDPRSEMLSQQMHTAMRQAGEMALKTLQGD